jgi:hypothetical protein
LKYCASINKVLTDHYYNYPEAPEDFPRWHNILIRHLEAAFLRYKDSSTTAKSLGRISSSPSTTRTTTSPR